MTALISLLFKTLAAALLLICLALPSSQARSTELKEICHETASF